MALPGDPRMVFGLRPMFGTMSAFLTCRMRPPGRDIRRGEHFAAAYDAFPTDSRKGSRRSKAREKSPERYGAQGAKPQEDLVCF